ncbi:MAG: hypothetical protein DWQ07_22840 [Chloroflexi bacterium]|nr:MAG: hypothetical protein DWQ07_22840 [Chloroflexota bacterium]MBL1193986.1 hypothetical protein [Chloroflexota bacterium]NOH11280.1 hypothetical protein [Chloroflexota bacterium]
MANKKEALPWGWIINIGVITKILLPITAFIWVFIYSFLINPGQTEAFYQAYAQTASSYVSIITGIPIFFFFAWWMGRRTGRRVMASAVLIWLIYVALDLPLLLFFDFSDVWIPTIIAHATKLLGAYLGALLAIKQSSESSPATA